MKVTTHDRLTEQGISWIATGRNRVNLVRAMELLAEKFGVERLAVTGGGHINGAFLEAGLIDEVSFMVAPGIDGRAGMAAAFDGIANPNRSATRLHLIGVSQLGQTVWMRYKFDNQENKYHY